jgi:transposase-like protein
MSKSVLSAPHFNDEAAAYAYVEARVWANGRVCPHCGVVDRSGALRGKSNRIGLYKCYACRKPFTVKVGTIFEASHIQMRDWLAAIYLICSSKKGVSSNQLHRTLGITLKSAWFLSHRIREAMKDGSLSPLGGEGATVEADETYIGRNSKPRVNKRGGEHKNKVIGLVERGGKARTIHVQTVTSESVKETLLQHADAKSDLMTDEALWYRKAGAEFNSHDAVHHRNKEYVRREKGKKVAHTNTIEGYFSVFKRGMKGIYQHCGERHLHRYLAEFDFRYNNRIALGVDDVTRTDNVVRGVVGKRLTYRTAHQGATA